MRGQNLERQRDDRLGCESEGQTNRVVFTKDMRDAHEQDVQHQSQAVNWFNVRRGNYEEARSRQG